MNPCDVVTVRCGVCAAEKREVNRWWIAWLTGDGVFCAAEYDAGLWEMLKVTEGEGRRVTAGADAGASADLLAAAGARRRAAPAAVVVCGEEHVLVLFQRWLSTGGLDG